MKRNCVITLLFSLPIILTGCTSNNEELKEEVRSEARQSDNDDSYLKSDIRKEAKADVEAQKAKEEAKKNVTDEAFLEAVADGFDQRQKMIKEKNPKWGSEDLVLAIDAELNEVAGFAEKEFKDQGLKEKATAYINALQGEKKAAEQMKTDLANGYFAYGNPNEVRVKKLLDFYGDYHLKPVSDFSTNAFKEFKSYDFDSEQAKTSSLVNSLQIKEVDENGFKKFVLSGTNTTDTTFKDLFFSMQAEDRDNNIVGTFSSNSLISLAPGQSFQLDVYVEPDGAYPALSDMYFLTEFYYNQLTIEENESN